jgi:hypothetical protein
MFDPLSTLWHVLIAVMITATIGYIFKWRPNHNYIEIALVFTGIYICAAKLMLPAEKLNTPLTTLLAEKKAISSDIGYHPRSGVSTPLFKGIRVDDGTFPDSVQKYYDTEIPIMGPLDGLSPTDMNTRLSYLYRKTATPYKPMTYFDFVSDADKALASAGKYQVLNGPTQAGPRDLSEYYIYMERWYPTLSKNQINERDCTNFKSTHPGSCLIKPESLLDNAGKKLVEKFENYTSQPRSLNTLKTFPTLFKNAEYSSADDTEGITDISGHISRGGVIGKCWSDYCGSRVLEPGNDNIVDIEKMFKAYLYGNSSDSVN